MVDHTSTMYPDTRTGARIDPGELRTVPMPELRTPQARVLDRQARGLYDTRTEQERVTAELVRIVDCLQGLVLRVEC